ncbi:unnamed protein product [Coregonus sp. 'balchen']|nr:unnamed protein product [Coregonus sp. 'balchen']
MPSLRPKPKLGINLTLHKDTSKVICQKCFRNISKVEKTMRVLHAWKAATQTPAFGTPSEEVVKAQQSPIETWRDATKTRCFNCNSLNEVPEKKRQREPSPPATGRGAKKRCDASTKAPEKNIMVEVVITYDPKLSHPKPGVASSDNKGRMWKQKRKVIASEFSGMIENLAMGNVVTFAKLSLTNDNISKEIRKQIVKKMQAEVKAYASLPNVFEPCILSSTSLENLKAFSYELSRKTPWLYTTINTATGGSTVHNCVAASVALRGRNPRLSALAYVINSTLTQGGG